MKQSQKQYPEPVVGAFILNSKGEILLIRSHKWGNRWIVPGGHVELGEKVEDALKREVMEETGLEVKSSEFLCFWDFIEEGEYYTRKHMIFLDFLLRPISESIAIKLNDEAEKYAWVSFLDALKLPLEKYTKLTLENYSEQIKNYLLSPV